MQPRNRVFLVDDEPLLLMELEDALGELGWQVVGTASRIESALSSAERLDYDIAVLDMNLAGDRIEPVAEVVVRKGAEAVYLSGYEQGAPHDGRLVQKPCTARQLHDVLTEVAKSHA